VWEKERFGTDVDETDEHDPDTKNKKTENLIVGHESIETYVKKQDAGDEEEE
jgi:hypothetical protein